MSFDHRDATAAAFVAECTSNVTMTETICRTATSSVLSSLGSKAQQEEELFLFLNKVQQDHDNAIISYYQNRKFETTQTLLVQILNDLRSYEGVVKDETKYVDHKKATVSSMSKEQAKLWFNHSVRPKTVYECNIHPYHHQAIHQLSQQQQPAFDRNDIPASTHVVALESSLPSSSFSSFQQEDQQRTDNFRNSDSADSVEEIYDGAMLLGNAPIVPKEMYEIAAVVMFNLALVHQQLYFTGETSQLGKAIRIYRQAITVLEGSTYITSCRALQVLLCASYHNCGQMFLSEPTISDLHQASTLFDRVQTILLYLIEQNEEKKQNEKKKKTKCPMEMEPDLHFFYRNLIFARISTQNGHSAAA
jgi:hypothetical protein